MGFSFLIHKRRIAKMMYSKCKRMTVTAFGVDFDGKASPIVTNGNLGECTGEEGKCGCIHAEARLLTWMPKPRYVRVSHSPCINCAKLLVEAGVEVVTFITPYRITDGVDYLIKNHVQVEDLSSNTVTYQPEIPIERVFIEGKLNMDEVQTDDRQD